MRRPCSGWVSSDSGRVAVAGRDVPLGDPIAACEARIGYVPEDRLTEGLFLAQSIVRNVAIGRLDAHERAGGLPRSQGPGRRGGAVAVAAQGQGARHRGAGPVALRRQPAAGGGSPRWLARAPQVLILNGPSVGVDVGSKADIHDIIRDLAGSGIGVIVISDDLPELLATCHRILVMRDGEVLDEIAAGAVNRGRTRPQARVMKRLVARNEMLVALVIVAFCAIATISDPLFLTVTTLSDLLRASIVLGILAVAAMMVLVSGGIDVSFTAVAVFAMYSTTIFSLGVWPEMPWYLIFALSMGIGALLGAINGIFIAGFGLPTLIVTLGTLSVFRGFLLTFVGSDRISALPPDMREFSRMMIARGTTEGGHFYSLPWAFAALVAVLAVTWLILQKSMLGPGHLRHRRFGGERPENRVGVDVRMTQFFVYVYVGALAGLAGDHPRRHGPHGRPVLAGRVELSVIAAGGAGGRPGLTGGYGTLTGHAARRRADRAGAEQPDRSSASPRPGRRRTIGLLMPARARGCRPTRPSARRRGPDEGTRDDHHHQSRPAAAPRPAASSHLPEFRLAVNRRRRPFLLMAAPGSPERFPVARRTSPLWRSSSRSFAILALAMTIAMMTGGIDPLGGPAWRTCRRSSRPRS